MHVLQQVIIEQSTHLVNVLAPHTLAIASLPDICCRQCQIHSHKVAPLEMVWHLRIPYKWLSMHGKIRLLSARPLILMHLHVQQLPSEVYGTCAHFNLFSFIIFSCSLHCSKAGEGSAQIRTCAGAADQYCCYRLYTSECMPARTTKSLYPHKYTTKMVPPPSFVVCPIYTCVLVQDPTSGLQTFADSCCSTERVKL